MTKEELVKILETLEFNPYLESEHEAIARYVLEHFVPKEEA